MIKVLYMVWLMGPYGPVEKVPYVIGFDYNWRGMSLESCIEARDAMNKAVVLPNTISYQCLPYSVQK